MSFKEVGDEEDDGGKRGGEEAKAMNEGQVSTKALNTIMELREKLREEKTEIEKSCIIQPS